MENKIKIKNDNGTEEEYEILFSFDSKNTLKKYIVYTNLKKENNTITCYSGMLEGGKIVPVTTEAELKVIDEMLNSLTYKTKTKYNLIEN